MIIGFSRVLYGKDYLEWVIRSMRPFVDKFVISYTPKPSNGMSTNLINPDSKQELQDIANKFGDFVLWIEPTPYTAEEIFKRVPQAELAFDADADEIFDPKLMSVVKEMYYAGLLPRFSYRIPRRHLWRSFDHIVINPPHDMPVKIYLPQHPWHHEQESAEINVQYPMFHFGYARKTKDMVYKWATSGHKFELHPEWWDKVWFGWPERTQGVFPLGPGMWDVIPFNKLALPEVMRDHPYYNLETI